MVSYVSVIYSSSLLRTYLLAKGNVKLFLSVIKHHVMKSYWKVEVQLHAFLTSVLDVGEWSGSRSGRFIPPGRERLVPIR